jgi:hypothetical protein
MSLAQLLRSTYRKSTRTLRRWLPAGSSRNALVFLSLAAIGLGLMRFVALGPSPFPSGSDGGGDLYGAHWWTGSAPSAGVDSPPLPPLYYFAVVLPFTSLFGTFTGIRLYVSVIPALLVFPGYRLFRLSGAQTRWAAVGGLLLAGSAAFSLMVSWNAAYNMFGIFLLLFFLASLPAALGRPTRRSVVWSAVCFGLVASAHELTLLVAGIALVVSCAGYVLMADAARAALKRAARLLLSCGAGALPLVPLYAQYLRVQAHSGLGAFGTNVAAVFQYAWFFPWGSQTSAIPAFLLLDIGLFSLGVLGWLYGRTSRPLYILTLAGVFVAACLVPFLDAAEAVRGLYFLPIPFWGAVVSALDAIDRRVAGSTPRRVRAAEPVHSPPPSGWTWRLSRLGAGARRAPIPALAVSGLAFVLVSTNLSYSAEVMQQSSTFYRTLDANGVQVLDWIRGHTPASASFYDGASLGAWVWGYANRVDYAPGPLAYQSTLGSYRATQEANWFEMGSSVISSSQVAAGMNLPAPVGTPTIYLPGPSGWFPFMTINAGDLSVMVSAGGNRSSVGLDDSNVTGVLLGTDSNGSVWERVALSWTAPQASAVEWLRIDGGALTLSIDSASDGSPLPISAQFALPPSGYFDDYSVSSSAPEMTWEGAFALPSGSTLLAHASGGEFLWQGTPSGWSQLRFNGTAFALNVTGGVRTAPASMALHTTAILAELGIGYAVVDYNRDYSVFSRLAAGLGDGWRASVVDRAGPIFVFQLEAP